MVATLSSATVSPKSREDETIPSDPSGDVQSEGGAGRELGGGKTPVELAEKFKGHRNPIGEWRAELLEDAAEVFATTAHKRGAGRTSKAARQAGPGEAG